MSNVGFKGAPPATVTTTRTRRIGLTRDSAPRLLRQVGDKQHATDDDHETDRISSSKNAIGPKKKAKTPPSVNDDPKSPSDVERSPMPSDDDDEQPNIPPSFHRDSSTLSQLSSQRASPQRRSRGVDTFDGSTDAPPKKRTKTNNGFKHVPELDFLDEFGGRSKSKPKKPKLMTKYGESSVPAKTFKRVNTDLPSGPTSATNTFRKPQLLTPNSSGMRNNSSQCSQNSYAGAEDFMDLPEQTGLPIEPKVNKKNLKQAKDLSSSLEAPSSQLDSSQERSEFRKVMTLTQAVKSMDPKIVKAEREKRRKEEAEWEQRATRLPDHGPCPMNCGKILPRSTLETLDSKASVKEQQRFCREHQIKDAEETWEAKGYPKDMDWKNLPDRLEGHEKTILRFFQKPDSLHFRKKMADRIKSGKSRNLLQQLKNEELDALGVGYYGTRGHDVMTNHISKAFARELRERVVGDKVMSAQGAMAYVQEVLVPELATLLIKEDMNVHPGEARRIMAESTEVGDLLHPSEASRSGNGKGGSAGRDLD